MNETYVVAAQHSGLLNQVHHPSALYYLLS